VWAFHLNKSKVNYMATDVTESHKVVWVGVCLPVAVACAAKETVTGLLAALAPKVQRPLVTEPIALQNMFCAGGSNSSKGRVPTSF
jgi:hypothetical protein